VFRRRLVLAVALLAASLAPAGAEAALRAVAVAAPHRGEAPLGVFFDGTASGADPGRTIVAWQWDFGDGESAIGAAVAHDYSESGLYTAKLTVTDDLGATSSAQVGVKVKALAVAQELALSLVPRTLVFGRTVTARGATTPVEAGSTVVVERRIAGGWDVLATTTTDASGMFRVGFVPMAGGAVRARVAGTASAEVKLAVLPRLELHRRPGRAFLGAPLRVGVRPLSYSGRVLVTVLRRGRVVGKVTGRVRDGQLRVTVPTPGIGRFAVRLRFPASAGLSARTVSTRVRARARTLSIGSRGPDVKAMLRRLAKLHYHVARISTRFGWAAQDAVIAFQKANGLSRSGIVGATTWQALGRARIPRVQYAKPFLHIEVDKGRQILMLVRDGAVVAVLPVSTGATGNTPLGAWRIYWKSAGYNGLGMYYSMYWLRGFAIHGYHSVPPYPASHGCVRIPIWAARWLYERSSVGERVYVYL
jgi:PKD domain/L,D-transpeptidase catalytic domain/Putative peptidoglycan binding domain